MGFSGGYVVSNFVSADSSAIEPLFLAFFKERFPGGMMDQISEIPLTLLIAECLDFFADQEIAGNECSGVALKKCLTAHIPRFSERIKDNARRLLMTRDPAAKEESRDGAVTYRYTSEKSSIKGLFLLQLLFEGLDDVRVVKEFSGRRFQFTCAQKEIEEVLRAPHVVKSLMGRWAEDIAINLADPSQQRNPLRADGMMGNIATSNYAEPDFYVVPYPLVIGRGITLLHVSGGKLPEDVTEEDLVVISAEDKRGLTAASKEDKARFTKPQSVGLRTAKAAPKLFHDRPGMKQREPNSVGVFLELGDVVCTQYKIYTGSTFDRPDAFFDVEQAKKYCDTVVCEKRSFGTLDALIRVIDAAPLQSGGEVLFNELLARVSWNVDRSAVLAYDLTPNALFQAMAIAALIRETLRQKYERNFGTVPFWFERFDIAVFIESIPAGYYGLLTKDRQEALKKDVSNVDLQKEWLSKREYGFLSFLDPAVLGSLRMSDGMPVVFRLILEGYQGKALMFLHKMGKSAAEYVADCIAKAPKGSQLDLKGALVMACQQNQITMVEALLKNGITITEKCLAQALRKKHLAILVLLIPYVLDNTTGDEAARDLFYRERGKVRIHFKRKPEDKELGRLLAVLDQKAPDAATGAMAVAYDRRCGVSEEEWYRVQTIVEKMVYHNMTHRSPFTKEQNALCHQFIILQERLGEKDSMTTIPSLWPAIVDGLTFEVDRVIAEDSAKSPAEKSSAPEAQPDPRKAQLALVLQAFERVLKILKVAGMDRRCVIWCTEGHTAAFVKVRPLVSSSTPLPTKPGEPLYEEVQKILETAFLRSLLSNSKLLFNHGLGPDVLTVVGRISSVLRAAVGFFEDNPTLQAIYDHVKAYLTLLLGGSAATLSVYAKEQLKQLLSPEFQKKLAAAEAHLAPQSAAAQAGPVLAKTVRPVEPTYSFGSLCFSRQPVPKDNNCGFVALGITREAFVSAMMTNQEKEGFRRELALEVLTEVTRDGFSEAQAGEAGIPWDLLREYQALRALPVPNADQTALIDEKLKSINECCQRMQAYEWYVTELGKPMRWLGRHSAKCYAMAANIDLTIYSMTGRGNELTEDISHKAPSGRKVLMLWSVAAGGHFDLLVESPNPRAGIASPPPPKKKGETTYTNKSRGQTLTLAYDIVLPNLTPEEDKRDIVYLPTIPIEVLNYGVLGGNKLTLLLCIIKKKFCVPANKVRAIQTLLDRGGVDLTQRAGGQEYMKGVLDFLVQYVGPTIDKCEEMFTVVERIIEMAIAAGIKFKCTNDGLFFIDSNLVAVPESDSKWSKKQDRLIDFIHQKLKERKACFVEVSTTPFAASALDAAGAASTTAPKTGPGGAGDEANQAGEERAGKKVRSGDGDVTKAPTSDSSSVAPSGP